MNDVTNGRGSAPRLRAHHYGLIGALLALAIPALWTLGWRSLEIDEGITAARALSGYSTAALSVLYEPNLTLYYTFSWLWARMGDSEIWLRLPSVLFALASVVLVYAVGSRLFGRRQGVFAAFVVALSPQVLQQAQNARPYAMLIFVSLLTTYLFLYSMDESSPRNWFYWGVASGFAVFVHPSAGLVSIAQCLFWFRDREKASFRDFRWGAGILAGAFVLLAAVLAITYDPRISWIPELSVANVLNAVGGVFGLNGLELSVALVIVAAFGAMYRRETQIATFALGWLLIPLALAALVSIAQPIIVARYMVVLLPPFAVMLGAVLGRLPLGASVIALAAFVFLTSSSYVNWLTGPDQGFGASAETIAAGVAPGDIVITDPLLVGSLDYHLKRLEASSDVPVYAPDLYLEPLRPYLTEPERIWQVSWRSNNPDIESMPGWEIEQRVRFNETTVTLLTRRGLESLACSGSRCIEDG